MYRDVVNEQPPSFDPPAPVLIPSVPFWKMSGSGNDFIVIDHRKALIPADQVKAFVAAVCRRGMSVGADGVILVESSEKATYRWHYYNADGGEVQMCGNGSRCVARFAYLQGIAPAQHTIETQVGLLQADVMGNGRVRVRLPDSSGLRLNLSVEIDGVAYPAHFVNTGVPHVVYFVDEVATADVVHLGRATRYHSAFAPQGTNANFVERINSRTLAIRTYERGVEDETLACGTGAVAAGIVAAARGLATAPVTVQTRSGIPLGVDFKQLPDRVTDLFLEGDARLVYKGELQPEGWKF